MAEEIQNTDQKSSYRSIFKATSLFGGVQVYQILIGVIKSKIVAILLGTSGLGIMSLYQSSIDLIKQVTSLGLSQSAVRDVSEANGTENIHRISVIITVLRKLVWATGVSGLLAAMFLSPVLSKVTFGNNDYIIPIIILSVTILFDQLCAGQKVILQGMRRLKDLAKASAIGSTFGLIVSVPLYYLMGIKGIVPTLLLNSITALSISYIYSHRIQLAKVKVTPKQTLEEGRVMLRMGIAMSSSNILSVAFAYVLRSYLRYEGGVESVGIFTAGYTIIFSYVNMFFTAMATDYYPRLAAVNKDDRKCREVVNQQGEVGALMLSPLLIICIVFMPFIIRLLYSEAFLEAYNFVIFAAFGMLFRFASVLVAHLFLAKGTAKLYIWNEALVNVYMLLFNLLGYKFWGLRGLGLSFILSFIIYLLQVYWLTHKYFNFSFSLSFLKIYGTQIFLTGLCLFVFLFVDSRLKYIFGIILIVISSIISFRGLNKRMNIMEFFKSKKR